MYKLKNNITYKLQKTKGDGNCLFRSISYALYDNEESHVKIRSDIVDHITEKWGEMKEIMNFYRVSAVVENNEKPKEPYKDAGEYATEMKRNGEYGTDIEISQVPDIYNRRVNLYQLKTNETESKKNEINGCQLKLMWTINSSCNKSVVTEDINLLFSNSRNNGHFDNLKIISKQKVSTIKTVEKNKTENKSSEKKKVENKLAEKKEIQTKKVENKTLDNKKVEKKTAEKKKVKNKSAENKIFENDLIENKYTENEESRKMKEVEENHKQTLEVEMINIENEIINSDHFNNLKIITEKDESENTIASVEDLNCLEDKKLLNKLGVVCHKKCNKRKIANIENDENNTDEIRSFKMHNTGSKSIAGRNESTISKIKYYKNETVEPNSNKYEINEINIDKNKETNKEDFLHLNEKSDTNFDKGEFILSNEEDVCLTFNCNELNKIENGKLRSELTHDGNMKTANK